MKYINLNDKTKIPQIGLGTWNIVGKKNVFTSLDACFANGYKHIDTAQYYNNEKEIGLYLKEKEIPRNNFYLTTKVWPSNFFNEQIFKKSIYQSIKRLQVKKVNLLLLHWAIAEKESIQAYKWLEEMKEKGLAISIGVSNFNIERLKAVLKIAKHKPVVNQVKFDVKNQQEVLSDFCFKNNIFMEGYSVLKPYLFKTISQTEKQTIDKIALKHKKSWSQVLLKWALQKNFIVFPKSVNPQRIKANIDLFDFELNKDEMETLNKMNDSSIIQRMDQVANDPNNDFAKEALIFENHFMKNEKEQIVEDEDQNKYK